MGEELGVEAGEMDRRSLLVFTLIAKPSKAKPIGFSFHGVAE